MLSSSLKVLLKAWRVSFFGFHCRLKNLDMDEFALLLCPRRICVDSQMNWRIEVPVVSLEFHIIVAKELDSFFCRAEYNVAFGPSLSAAKLISFLFCVSNG